jgi:UPF0716 protein FxsA
MRLALLLIFIAVPLLEIALLIKTGQWLGFWPTIGIVIFTAILGSFMLRWQGLAVMARAGEAIRAGRMPLEPVVDGVFLLFAGALLLTPGIATDGVGLLLLLPAVRRWIGQRVLNAILKSENIDFQTGGGGMERPSRSSQRDGPIIEGEYERVEEDDSTRGPDR